MKDKIKNLLTHGFNKRILIAILVLAIADVFTMAAPYYLKYIIPKVHDYLGVHQSQFDKLNATLGYVVLATQIPGGWLADKFSSKKMLSTSLFMTGMLSIWWTLIIQVDFSASAAMSQLYVIYIGWGISTTLIFWTPLWKLLSQLASKEKQGVAFGLHGTMNGLAGLLVITGLGTIATYLSGKGESWAFYSFSYVLSAILIVTGILTLKYVPEKGFKSKISKKISEIEWKKIFISLVKPMKSVRVWLLAFFVMGMYMFQSVFAYYMKSTISTLGVAATALAIIAGFRTYGFRMIFSSPFGRWADKRKSYILILIWVLLIGGILALIFILLPGYNAAFLSWSSETRLLVQILVSILYLVVGILSWFLVALRYVQVVEIPVEKGSYATVIALISFVAFSPDAWFYHLASEIGSRYQEKGSYTLEGLQIILFVAIGVIIFGLICGTLVFAINKKEIKSMGIKDYRWRKLRNE